MSNIKPIPVVDLFAGPGGLGEGFSALDEGKMFRILVSAEMDAAAHQTLRLRSFFRILKKEGGSNLDDYYNFCNGLSETIFSKKSENAWIESGEEAKQLTLGKEIDNQNLFRIFKNAKLSDTTPWVLIGGPPCQAYSLVGRSRNLGKINYRAEDDHRHYLYREYLKIIQKFKPSIFVMENVKGILSSKVNGKKIFHSILKDLSDPDLTIGKTKGVGYKIYSLANNTVFDKNMSPEDINIHDFIIRSEDYGIPQARHRVILLGVRSDLDVSPLRLQKSENLATVADAIFDLPELRSKLTKAEDGSDKWTREVENHLHELSLEASYRGETDKLNLKFQELQGKILSGASSGGLRYKKCKKYKSKFTILDKWFLDDRLEFWLNHEARGHMSSDLRRYLYASCFALAYGVNPKGHGQFELKGLKPNHKNWESGDFSDRFKVQLKNAPASTITSHISKDGHYFIHPDPSQCRSLTVREAARIQTFPDNYFFLGNRTQQFHQVGNAVPPLLAYKIAETVRSLLK